MVTNQVQKSSPVQPSDDELMEAVQKGHRPSFAALFQRHGPPVLRYARMLTGSLTDAQDLTQEVFLKAYAQRMAYRNMGKMKSWLFTICRHLHLDQVRRRGVRVIPMDLETLPGRLTRQTGTGATSSPAPEPFFSHPLVEQFPPETKEILFLRIVEECSYREIADLTGNSSDALRQMVSRALHTMRERGEVAA